MTRFNWSVTSIFCTEWWREISSSIVGKRLDQNHEFRVLARDKRRCHRLAIQSLSHVFLFWPLSSNLCFSCTIEVSKNKLVAITSSSESMEAMFVCRDYEVARCDFVARQSRARKSQVWHRTNNDTFSTK